MLSRLIACQPKRKWPYLDIEGAAECFGMETIETLTPEQIFDARGRWLCSVKRQAG
jgi:hypothetical protein